MTDEKSTARKLSTGVGLTPKKREAEKRKSPFTPYREKGKGKEINPGANRTGLSRAGARVRGVAAKRIVSAAVEDALVTFHGTRGPGNSDEALWAKFAWEFGAGKFRDLCRQAKGELDARKDAPPPSKWPSILQNILSPFWNERFPKGGAR